MTPFIFSIQGKFKILSLIIFLFLQSIHIHSVAQPTAVKFQEALALKEQSKWEESLAIFEALLKNDSANVDYLTNTCYLTCKAGNRLPDEGKRQAYFKKAEYLAKKAISLNPNSAQAHYNYALALGRMNENASSRQKISNAKLIKKECDDAIRLDPKLAGAHHILGRWHRTIAGFNFAEKAMINTLFGGVPEGGSYDASIESFSKAILLEPDVMLHKFELAVTYSERDHKGDDVLCRVWCKKVLEMTAKDADDRDSQEKAKILLKKSE
ncbi:MAG TPA: tetratricopeptide repeat protein [Bacteroidia bacterium]|nr:tetratricopeptide repeat protein [Bacteroidia bacterium]